MTTRFFPAIAVFRARAPAFYFPAQRGKATEVSRS